MLDPPHKSAPMLMRGNALVLKTPVENAPRTSIEKHVSWSPDIPPASRFPLHRSRPAEYQPNRQPATVYCTFPCGQQMVKYGYKETAECTLCKKAHEEGATGSSWNRELPNCSYSECGMPWTKGGSYCSTQCVHQRAATGS